MREMLNGERGVAADERCRLIAGSGNAARPIILGSIVIPLAILTAVCWFFWKRRHDD